MDNYQTHERAQELADTNSSYELAKRLILAETKRGALAAQLAEASSAIDQVIALDRVENGRVVVDLEELRNVRFVLDADPGALLVRRDNVMKAEALERFANAWEERTELSGTGAETLARRLAKAYRQLAEGEQQ